MSKKGSGGKRQMVDAKLDPKTPPPHTWSCSSALPPKQPSDHITPLHDPGLGLAVEEEEEYVSEAGLPAALEEFTATYRDAETIT
eukprot:superscaffoldBa00008147_g23119